MVELLTGPVKGKLGVQGLQRGFAGLGFLGFRVYCSAEKATRRRPHGSSRTGTLASESKDRNPKPQDLGLPV